MSKILDLTIVNETRELMKDKFPMMVQYFIEDTETYINNINDGIADADAKQVKVAAHTIKSSAASLGAMKLSELAKKTEFKAREMMETADANFTEVNNMRDELKIAFHEAEAEFEKLLK